jgi:hypothetical protein
MTDLAPEKAMEEILHKLEREYAEEGKQEPQPAAAVPDDSRKGR